MPLESKILSLFERHLGTDFRSWHYVIAVSGGLDSMVLLEVMSRLLPSSQLVVAHFNHRLRGNESQGDEKLVKISARRKKLRFEREERRGPGTSEASLREERWKFLSSFTSDYIVTAHHIEDQLETFLMRLLRGTGLEGLGGIGVKNGKRFRPLLKVSREEIREYARREKIRFREDSTNARSDYLRNRVRLALTPELFKLSQEFGGKECFLAKFADTIEEVQAARHRLQKQAASLYAAICVETPFWSRLSHARFLRLTPERQKLILRRLFKRLGAETPGRERLNRLLIAISDDKKRWTAGGGVSLENSCGFLFFQNPSQRRLLAQAHPLLRQGDTLQCKPLGLRLRVDEGLFDELECRFFMPGDALGKTKLKKWFLNERIPAPERRIVPLLARRASSQVTWVFPQAFPGVKVEYISFPFTFFA